ncbi:hypothetical protein OSB04_012740 [Centaurea solstitialis]|uniref:Uncharacterized protein n=1 Tax=Centaurea solstitialis TaxID=347529 RepID=A0AA38WQU7_9ASTR|nr:hypothetical protein OSB04_012740 [Centaurea solstitialis]
MKRCNNTVSQGRGNFGKPVEHHESVTSSIAYALNMPAEEREKQHHNNLMHGFNATLTELVDSGRWVDHFKEMEPRLHPEVKESLRKLCDDPKSTVVVLSGSHHSILDKNFGEFNIWLAAEHGVFLRTPNKKWIRNLPKIHMDWVDSMKV